MGIGRIVAVGATALLLTACGSETRFTFEDNTHECGILEQSKGTGSFKPLGRYCKVDETTNPR